jgi:hypothetical protein
MDDSTHDSPCCFESSTSTEHFVVSKQRKIPCFETAKEKSEVEDILV